MTKMIRETLARLDQTAELQGDDSAAKAANQIRESQRQIAKARRDRAARNAADKARADETANLIALIRGA